MKDDERLDERVEQIRPRLREYMEARRISNAELARKLVLNSVSTNQWVTDSKSKRRTHLGFVGLLLDSDPNLSAEWLMRGEGSMDKKESESESIERLKMELSIKDGIISELRSIILEKNELGKESVV